MPNTRHIDKYLDHAVGSIVIGALSRGVVNSTRRDQFVADRYAAMAGGRISFVAGMDDTVRTLFARKTPAALDSWQANLATSGRKRATYAGLEAWRLDLQHVPDTTPQDGIAEFERGRIQGALALSGLHADYDTSNPIKRVELTAANGYTAAYDDETGALKSHIRLVNALPEDHPTGTPALTTYWPNGKVKRETHYRGGRLHDGSGDTPTTVWNIGNRLGDGENRPGKEWHANSGIRIERSVPNPNRRWGGDLKQDSPDGQPAFEWLSADGSSSIQHAAGGSTQDPAPGRHGRIDTAPDGATVRHHMLASMQHDPDDDTPAVTAHRADGTLERTVRYFRNIAWDGRNGEPSIIQYAPDGSIEKTIHAGVVYPDSGYPYFPTSETGPIERAEKRETRNWLVSKPTARIEPADSRP